MVSLHVRCAWWRRAQIHVFLARTGFYPLFFATLVAFAFMITRITLTHTGHYRFLLWNLFLAWVPYWCAQAIVYLREHRPQRRRLAWTLGIAWLLFFPNAPYIATDFKHFLYMPKLTWWFDAGLILSFVLAGCFLAVVSLRLMQQIVQRAHGELIGWAFALGVILLSGVGIDIGRFARLNSWDVFVRPQRVFALSFAAFDPLAHVRTIGVTLMFSALLLACYVMFQWAAQVRESAEA